MKPIKSFIFIFLAGAILFAISYYSPQNKVKLWGMELRIYQIPEFQAPPKKLITQTEIRVGQPDTLIREEIALDTIPNLIATLPKTITQLPEVITDVPKDIKLTVPATVKKEIPQPIKKADKPKQDNLVRTTQIHDTQIILPNDSNNIWGQLNEKLLSINDQKKPIRILYYGDSQIENDRITSIFRKKLQDRFGGNGRGLVPVKSIYNTANNLVMTTSKNWKSSSIIGTNRSNLDLGLLCEAFKTKHTQNQSDSCSSSWIKINKLNLNKLEGYSVVSIFYKADKNSEVELESNGEKLYTQTLAATNEVEEIRFNLQTTPEKIKLKFKTSSEITIYGLNLESPNGIMVDNIALRGRAHPSFTKINADHFGQMAKLIDPAFIIMQYGVNVVPHITTNYSYYKKMLVKEIQYVNEILPDVPILLVGVSDMAKKVDGNLQSYPNLKYVIETQRETAMENNCAFWDLFETMGGEGSMIEWAQMNPPLGNKDYVHYTNLGAEKVGDLFANEFLRAIDYQMATVSITNGN